MKRFFKIGQRVSLGFWPLVFIGWLVVGCASIKDKEVQNSPSPAVIKESINDHPIQEPFAVGDLIVVKFSGTEDRILPHEERIKEDGNITMPLIGTVKADGKTPREFLKEIHDRYVPHYYKQLVITLGGGQNVYYVGGQVSSPGRQVYLGTTTVMKAIQSAGGLTDVAAKDRVQLIRENGQTLEVNCIKAARDRSLDLQVFPGDKIVVPKRSWRDLF